MEKINFSVVETPASVEALASTFEPDAQVDLIAKSAGLVTTAVKR